MQRQGSSEDATDPGPAPAPAPDPDAALPLVSRTAQTRRVWSAAPDRSRRVPADRPGTTVHESRRDGHRRWLHWGKLFSVVDPDWKSMRTLYTN